MMSINPAVCGRFATVANYCSRNCY